MEEHSHGSMMATSYQDAGQCNLYNLEHEGRSATPLPPPRILPPH